MGVHRNWTDEETDYLEDKIGVLAMSTIAKHLHRTETACYVKAKRLGIGCFKNNTDKISVGEVAEMLNIDRATVYYMIRNNKIKYSRRIIRNKTFQYFFDIDYIYEFAKIYNKQSHKAWTEYDVSRLKCLLSQHLSYKEIAEKMNRSVTAIEHKANRLTKILQHKNN